MDLMVPGLSRWSSTTAKERKTVAVLERRR